VSTGVYVYHERAMRYLREEPCQFPDLVLRLLAAGERVAAWETDAEWFDIGTVGEYERAAADVERQPERYNMDPLDLPPLEAPHALAPVDGPSRQGDWRLTANANGRRP
jgi:NDP-sugar pyrophosphorylase family protein